MILDNRRFIALIGIRGLTIRPVFARVLNTARKAASKPHSLNLLPTPPFPRLHRRGPIEAISQGARRRTPSRFRAFIGAAAWGRNLVEAFAHAEGFRFDRTTFDCR